MENLHLPIRLRFQLEVDKILSENTLYAPTVGKRGKGPNAKHFGYLRLSNTGRAYKKDLESRLDVLITTDQKAMLKALDKQKIRVSVHYRMFLPKSTIFTKEGRFKKRMDLTNMIKATEDSIFNVLGFDDCNVRVSIAEKIPVDADPTFRPIINVNMTITKLDQELELQTPIRGQSFHMEIDS